MPELESDLLQSLERTGGKVQRRGPPLEGEPGVAQAFCSRGSLLWDQLQHGKQEVCEALRLFAGTLVLVYQHLQETPRLQLGDVFQIPCRRPQTHRVRPTAKVAAVHSKC